MRFVSTLAAAALVIAVTVSSAFAAERWQRLPAPPAMPVSNVAGYAPVNGIHMYYAVYGAGDPILLIHGGLGHADIWSNQVKDLMKDHMVIVADSRGHGRSTRNADPYSYDLMASDYLALLDYLKVDKVALVGWSDGGIIGLDIAMKHPERLSKLFAQAANVTVDGVKPDVMEAKVFAAYVTRSGEDYKKMSKTPDQYDAFVEQISHMWATQPNWSDAELGKITVPTAIVLGDHDEAIKRDHTEHMAEVIPGAKLIILKDASHFAMLQDPKGYTKAVRDFLSEQ
ncbi:MAG TPA: alpha/beta hydrolase [Dongiaceae bacterium]|jgi:pimeloyl-ACP methyl ester carboxylesterase|nr:alpha/beta hydrolase [Dongiaceae bacterium]